MSHTAQGIWGCPGWQGPSRVPFVAIGGRFGSVTVVDGGTRPNRALCQPNFNKTLACKKITWKSRLRWPHCFVVSKDEPKWPKW